MSNSSLATSAAWTSQRKLKAPHSSLFSHWKNIYIHKGHFRDALYMGGFPNICHNEIMRVATSQSHNVPTESSLQPGTYVAHSWKTVTAHSTNTDDGAHLDILARGFWNVWQDPYCDVRFFYLNASSNHLTSSTSSIYRRHEKAKQEYGQCNKKVERGVFTTLSSQLSVEWEGRCPLFTNTLQIYYRKGNTPTQ